MNTLHIFYDERGIWLLCVDLWKFSVQRWFLWIILLQYVQCWVFRLLFCFRHGYAGVIPGMMNKIKSVYLIKAEIFWITMDIQRSRFIQNILETKKEKIENNNLFLTVTAKTLIYLIYTCIFHLPLKYLKIRTGQFLENQNLSMTIDSSFWF